ncbi:hypothetical protein GGF32_008984 [Allomyces javanicus]|nr:hypothetical protein GGF32_008984 [Allomyces javanicus]
MQHFLLTILSPTTLPDGTPAYGQESPAVVIDADRRLDPIRLRQTLVTHVVQCLLSAQGFEGHEAQVISELERDPDVHDVVHAALNRVSVYRVDHPQQLLAVLRTLARRIESEPPSSIWSPPRYLIIDSLSMPLWPLKSATAPVPQEYDDLSRTILAQLARIRHRGVTVIASTWEVFARRHLGSVLRSQPGRPRGSTATSGLSADAVAQLVRQVDAHDPVAIAHALHIKAVDTLGAAIGKSVTFRFVLTRLDTVEEAEADDEGSFDPDPALSINLLDVLLTCATLARLLRGDLVSDALAVCQAAWALSPVLAATLQDFEYEGIEEWVETVMETAEKNPSYYLSRDRLPLVLTDAVALFSNLDAASRAIEHFCEPFARISGDPAATPAVLRVVSPPAATERALGRHRRRAAVTARKLRFYGEYVEWLVMDPEGQEEHARMVQLLRKKPAAKDGPGAGSFAVQTVGGEVIQEEESADCGVLSVFEALSLTRSGGSSVMGKSLIELL